MTSMLVDVTQWLAGRMLQLVIDIQSTLELMARLIQLKTVQAFNLYPLSPHSNSRCCAWGPPLGTVSVGMFTSLCRHSL